MSGELTLEDYVRQVVDRAPPLSAHQREVIAAVFQSARSTLPAPVDPPPARPRLGPTLGPPRPEPTALYRHRDDDGVLLYVGITNDLNGRRAAHRRDTVWFEFTDPARETAEWFPAREPAEQAEADAIDTEAPVFNLRGRSEADRTEAARYLAERGRFEHLRWARA